MQALGQGLGQQRDLLLLFGQALPLRSRPLGQVGNLGVLLGNAAIALCDPALAVGNPSITVGDQGKQFGFFGHQGFVALGGGDFQQVFFNARPLLAQVFQLDAQPSRRTRGLGLGEERWQVCTQHGRAFEVGTQGFFADGVGRVQPVVQQRRVHPGQAQALGAGEIVLNCMGADGVRGGYDLEQLRAVRAVCQVPLVASGGAGAPEHFAAAFLDADVDAALAASVFHSGAIRIPELKTTLRAQGIEVRDVA